MTGSRWPPALAVVVGAAALLASCSPDGPDGPDAGTTVATASEPPVDRAAAIAAAVDVRADGCGPRVGFGTGSMIDDDLAATAAHVVAGAGSIELIDTEGRRTGGIVVLFDPELDVALVRVAEPVGTALAVRPDDAERGEEGIVVLPRLTADGVVVDVADVAVLRPANIRTTDIYRDAPVERPGFEIEGSIDPGDSGAMVVLPGGGAGVVWARSNVNERRAWAIDLPDVVIAGDTAALDVPVDVGPCIR